MKMLQIRNVPDELHPRLKARAALEGTSLSEFALAELRRSLERPTRTELLERVRQRAATDADGESAADGRARGADAADRLTRTERHATVWSSPGRPRDAERLRGLLGL